MLLWLMNLGFAGSPVEAVVVEVTRYDLLGSDTTKFVLRTGSISYSDQLDEMLVASPTGDYLDIFSTEDFTGNGSVYNVALWAADLDFTGCAWWAVDSGDNDVSNDKKSGTLISPRHTLIAFHSNFVTGYKTTWVAADGKSYMRTLLGLSDELGAGVNHDLRMGYYGLPGTDAGVVATDPDLPSTLANYSILPESYENYSADFPPYVDQTPTVVMPIIVVDQERQALVREWFQMRIVGGNAYMQGRDASIGNRPNYTEKLVGGDSSHPKFVLLHGELVFLSTQFTSVEGTPPHVTTAPFLADDIDEINTTMRELELAADAGNEDNYQLSVWAPPADIQSTLTGTASANQALVGV